MPVEIKIFHDDARSALLELAELSAGLLGPTHRPVDEAALALQVADAMSRQRGENIDGSTRRETIAAETAPKARRGRPPKAVEPVATVPEEAVPEILAAIEEQKVEEASKPAISITPEDRVNPDDEPAAEEEDDGIEDMPQPGAKLTVDDLRNAAGRINRALGNNPAKAQELAAPAFVKHGVKSISTCPDDKLADMVAELNAIAARIEIKADMGAK